MLLKFEFIIDEVILWTSEEEYIKELHVLKNHGDTQHLLSWQMVLSPVIINKWKSKQVLQDRWYDL